MSSYIEKTTNHTSMPLFIKGSAVTIINLGRSMNRSGTMFSGVHTQFIE